MTGIKKDSRVYIVSNERVYSFTLESVSPQPITNIFVPSVLKVRPLDPLLPPVSLLPLISNKCSNCAVACAGVKEFRLKIRNINNIFLKI